MKDKEFLGTPFYFAEFFGEREGIMRLQSRKKVVVKNKVFGGEDMLVCLPLVSSNKETLIKDAGKICEYNPDVIEWRVDYFDTVNDAESVVDALESLSEVIGEKPLIFTCRHKREGGQSDFSDMKRVDIIRKAVSTGAVDLLDIEMSSDREALEDIKRISEEKDVKLILSYHNFEETPDESGIVEKLAEGERLGADISKLAVMPNCHGDVLNLLSASCLARKEVDIPLITVSMGEMGSLTRIVGGMFGSDLSFAVGSESSAPGQVPIEDMRKMLGLLTNQVLV